MIVRSKNGTYQAIDFRERAPAAAEQDMYNNNTHASLYGGLAVGIPGELRGLEYLHQQYGSKPWKQLVEPAMNLARTGFQVTEDFVSYMNSTTPSLAFLYQDPTWAIDFTPAGKLPSVNDTMTRRRYADTLEVIARKGAAAFYSGPIANATVQAIQSSGGILTLRDLRDYTVRLRQHVSIKYHNFSLHSLGAPSSGPVVLGIMNTVQSYQMGDAKTVNLTTHRLDEAIRFGYGEVSCWSMSAFDNVLTQSSEQKWETPCSSPASFSIKQICSMIQRRLSSGPRSPIIIHRTSALMIPIY